MVYLHDLESLLVKLFLFVRMYVISLEAVGYSLENFWSVPNLAPHILS